MRIVLAPDSFKECISAHDACDCIATGIHAVFPEAEVLPRPMADGGEGTGDVLREALGCETCVCDVSGPHGRTLQARYWISRDGKVGLVETAEANGLHLVPPDTRNPMLTSTFGCGQILRNVLDAGVERVLLSVGGSSTVDGGLGLALALGYEFLDSDGSPVGQGGSALSEIARIVAPADISWSDVRFEVICDVNNPLLGERGAARVFGPQKGATPEMVDRLEAGLGLMAKIVERDLGMHVADLPGAGAAGGLAAGLAAFVGAELLPGVDVVMDLIDLDQALRDADLVITGEGKTDSQTAGGKVCAGVATRAKKAGVPCVILAGSISGDIQELRTLGVTAAFSLSQGPEDLAAAMAAAPDRLKVMGANIASLRFA